ncbi:cyclohexanone monooxygenase [Hirsutella rhossiliensis]|uniref:Cyclohexanone monooxygenase n=1 Tax=Hirsutella rhossiliensis TaxID=111463 RepID=A0A9P8N4L5_9HYPO|nr:cyclohexanone monooxygenase [Hirsutella rhossiliensis]KAH0965714.1 cyclohexanone monooxygenase [Hirsutella rhossiliensis]
MPAAKAPTGATATPSPFYHEYQPDFDKEFAETQRFLAGKQCIKSPRKLRIMAIGAGASSLAFARENAGVGGTWWENRYAGCACDVPSHNYQFAWAANPNWSKYYAEAPEIKRYFESVARKFDLEPYIKLEHEVVKAQWKTAKWEIEVKNKATGQLLTDAGDVLVNGVQITASMVVDKMTVVMRSPTWITIGFAPAFAGPGGTNFEYSEEQKQKWREDAEAYLQFRKQVEGELSRGQNFFLKGTPEQRMARDFSYREMKKGLAAKPELMDKLTPSFDMGCRRPSPGNGFLETLTQSNVDVAWGTPQCVKDKTIILGDQREIQPDFIVCATGFELSYKPNNERRLFHKGGGGGEL